METEEHNPFAPPDSLTSLPTAAATASTWKPILWTSGLAAFVTGLSFTSWGKTFGLTSGAEVAVVLGSGLAIASLMLAGRRSFRHTFFLTQFMNLSTWLTMYATGTVGFRMLRGSLLSSSETQIFGWIWLAGCPVAAVIAWLGSLFHRHPQKPTTPADPAPQKTGEAPTN